jgi:hypothetical protein
MRQPQRRSHEPLPDLLTQYIAPSRSHQSPDGCDTIDKETNLHKPFRKIAVSIWNSIHAAFY